MRDVVEGDRVRLIHMPDDPDPVSPGTEGTVTQVTHFNGLPTSRSRWEGSHPVETGLPAPPTTSQVSVAWDDGRTLALSVPHDTFMVL